MKLVLSGDQIEETIDDNLLRETIMTLEPDDDSFVILEQDDMTYMQTAGSPLNGYIIEYQDGSLAKQYSCTNTNIDVEDVINAFQSYLNQDGHWKSDLHWQHEEPVSDGVTGSLGRYIRVAALMVAGGAAVWWLVRVFS